ncbi:flagellar basal body-associated protein FliL [Aquicoccus sp. G2-2]|uniref:flagellar basal body-associated FliL family protein n=1 Tax=Aquicoccus sp. G2-2 TaxID=3092120 RepID=UPI002AE03474|nr:flagellar basal body-associated FliL family protein [Aquicoccus sp. G2-2]MEA1114392.1 flagellar basal body-associated FliL family protein [Aquicoccus sp. G2-2]
MAKSEENAPEEESNPSKKRSKLPLFIGLFLALVGAGAGFHAVASGLLFRPDSVAAKTTHDAPVPQAHAADMPDIAFVPVDPIIVSLGMAKAARHLRFRAQLEVPSKYQVDVETLLPRVVDVLNNYLRALELGDLTDPAALVRLRAQMLRRIQIVTGAGRVNDLLIMEFVLN